MLTFVTLAWTSLAAGCGGDGSDDDGPMTLEAYFDRIAEIREESREQADEIVAEMDSRAQDAEGTEGSIPVLEDGLRQFEELASSVVTDLNDITPPQEAQAAHASVTAAFETGAVAIGDAQDALGDVDSEDELQAFTAEVDQEFADLTASADAACLELQAVADDNGIDVELSCEE
jgi:hypothetical protein